MKVTKRAGYGRKSSFAFSSPRNKSRVRHVMRASPPRVVAGLAWITVRRVPLAGTVRLGVHGQP